MNNKLDLLLDIIEQLCLLFDNGQLTGRYRKSNSTISFYVFDINKQDIVLTLRISDHLPKMDNYVNKYQLPPHMTTNISITLSNLSSRLRDRVFVNIKDEDYYLPFSLISYEYKLSYLTQDDTKLIYNAIVDLLSNNDTDYHDPLSNTNKKAKRIVKESKIKYSKLKWICDALRNYYRRYLLGDSLQQEYNKVLNESLYQLQPYIKTKDDANRLADVLQTFILERYGKI